MFRSEAQMVYVVMKIWSELMPAIQNLRQIFAKTMKSNMKVPWHQKHIEYAFHPTAFFIFQSFHEVLYYRFLWIDVRHLLDDICVFVCWELFYLAMQIHSMSADVVNDI